jgi:small GTP-binding protein
MALEAKIVVLGSMGAGKTSLVNRYVKSSFNPASTTSTVGASFLTKRVVDNDSDTVVRLQIWDTAGQERFRSISRLYYRGANACILCYDITSEASFVEMGVWLAELKKNLPADIILHIVGTKADIVTKYPERRKVPFERCIAYVADNLYPSLSSTPPPTATPSRGITGSGGSSAYASYFGGLEGARSPGSKRSSGFWGQDVGWDCCHEISAESGEGVEEVFRVITRKLVDQVRQKMEKDRQTEGGISGNLGDDLSGYFDQQRRPVGSFRMTKDRRSWFGVPNGFSTPGIEVDEHTEQTNGEVKPGKKCC